MSGDSNDLSFLEEGLQKTTKTNSTAFLENTQTTETRQTTPAVEEKSAVDTFAEKLAQYADADEAKKHFKEISAGIGCSPQLGYKAIKKVAKFKSADGEKPKIMTMKIGRAKTPPPAPEPPQPDQPVKAGDWTPPPQPPTQPPPTFTPPSMFDPNQTEKLQQVIEHQVPKALEHVFDMIGGKLGANGEKGESFLDAEDKADLAVLVPVLIAKVTHSQMTPEMTENVALGSFAGQLALKGIKNRMLNKPQDKPAPKPEPTPAPTEKQAPQEPPKPAEQPALDTEFKHGKPAFYNHLG